MKLTKKIEYALMGLYFLGYVRPHAFVQVRTVADELDVPKRFLEQIFLDLRERGILESRRGSHGGYALQVPPSDISLGLLYRILEGSEPPVRPPLAATGAARFAWEAQTALWRALDATTLDQLMHEDLKAYLRSGSSASMLYYI